MADEHTVSLNGTTLHVLDVENSLDFYKRIPGAELIIHRPNQFALLKFGQGRLGLLKWKTPTFHIEMDSNDMDAMHAQLVENGITPEGPPQDHPWGQRDFLVLDPDGNMIEFGQQHEENKLPAKHAKKREKETNMYKSSTRK